MSVLITNMLINLKNASMAGRDEVEVPHSKYSEFLARVLLDAGYLSDVRVFKEKSFKRLHLSTAGRKRRLFLGLKVVSRPGRRLYYSVPKLTQLLRKGRRGMFISTSQGLMDVGSAVKRKLGGEVVCEFS